MERLNTFSNTFVKKLEIAKNTLKNKIDEK
jgi:hypothetical protein